MCDGHEHAAGISRRNLGSMFLGAAALSLLPVRGHAAGEIHTLSLMCIDYRLVDRAVSFLDQHNATANYDLVALAGASLAGVWDHWTSKPTVWDQIAVAKKLHHIKNVMVLDHRDCGAYKVAFGSKYEGKDPGETAQHKAVMERFKRTLAKKQPDLTSEYYLMALDGTADKIM